MPGYPIRTPWDPRSVDNSPRPIAASHVLHRLLVPRHPPFALTNLTTKMLASTMQFSNNTPPTTHTHHLRPTQPRPQTQPHTTRFGRRWHRPETTTTPTRTPLHRGSPTRGRVVLSGPNRMFPPPHHHQRFPAPHPHPKTRGTGRTRETPTGGVICQCLRQRAPPTSIRCLKRVPTHHTVTRGWEVAP